MLFLENAMLNAIAHKIIKVFIMKFYLKLLNVAKLIYVKDYFLYVMKKWILLF